MYQYFRLGRGLRGHDFPTTKTRTSFASIGSYAPEWMRFHLCYLFILSSFFGCVCAGGMYQYFRLVEGCVGMITDYETQNKFRFNWILRTRVDTFWAKPPPSPRTVPQKYTIPFGTGLYGMNDRLGVGTWYTTARPYYGCPSSPPSRYATTSKPLTLLFSLLPCAPVTVTSECHWGA